MGTTLPTQRKTTTAVNLSARLAFKNYNTLLIDLDPQASATLLMQATEPELHIGDALLREKKISEIIQKTDIDKLDVAPSDERLNSDEFKLRDEIFTERHLKKALDGIKYDFIIIDCPPSLNSLSINALYACDMALIPVKPGPLPLDGISRLFKTIDAVKENFEFGRKRIFLNLYKGKSVDKWADGELEDISELVMKTKIRELVAYEQAQILRESIFSYEPKGKAAMDFTNFTEEFLEYVQNIG